MSLRDHRSKSKGVAIDPEVLAEPGPIGHRQERLERVMLDELSSILRDEATNPKLDGVTFNRVELSADYRNARVWFRAADGTQAEAQQALEKSSAFLRARMAELMDLKRVPLLRFVLERGDIDDDGSE